jgi:predicted dehydrogenase
MVAGGDTLRAAIVGYGLAGSVFHAPLIAATPGIAVAGIVTGNPERRERARRDFPAADLLSSAGEVWSSPRRYDLAVVATPNRFHAPLATAAMEAGLPVVVDKPLATSAAEAQGLIATAGRTGVPLGVFQNRRWDGDFLTVRKLIDEGRLGEVTRFESRFERWRPTPKGGWREVGGVEDAAGLLYDLGSHLVDQALHLFGPATVLHAETDVRRAGVKSDDDTFIALEHDNGVRSHLWMSAVASDLGPRFRVLGSQAAYVKYGLDVQEDALRGGRRPGDKNWGADEPGSFGTLGTPGTTQTVETELGAYENYYAGIADALLDGAPVPVDPTDAVRSLEILESARRLAQARG